MNKTNWIAVAAALVPLEAWTASDHHQAIPWPTVYSQIFNFTLFVLLFVFLVRKQIVQYFKGRRDQFLSAERAAQEARKRAEEQKAAITERLNKLDRESGESLAKAKAEAEALKNQIVQEARNLSKGLAEDAARTARHEVERAKAELREALLNQSIERARQILGERLNEPDQRRLQTEFVDKIQVVR